TATRLQDGTVLIAGGSGLPAATSAERFDPVANIFSAAGTLLTPRVDHTATLLSDRSVLLTRGPDRTVCRPNIPPQASMDRYLPGVGFVGAGSLIASRYVHTASAIGGGRVVLAGTFGWSVIGSRSAETYDPATAVALQSASPPDGKSGTPYSGFTLNGTGGSG